MNTSKILERLKSFSRKSNSVGSLVKSVSFTDEPKFKQWFCRPKSSNSGLSEEQYGSGISTKESLAQLKALAESVERYCSSVVSQVTISGSFKELKRRNPVDPEKFLNFSEDIMGMTRSEYGSYLREFQLDWVEGLDERRMQKVIIPAQIVYSPYDFKGEPIIRIPISTGAAFGPNFSFARERGLLEIVERDSFSIAWLTKRKFPKIELKKKDLKELESYFNRYALEISTFDITTDLDIPSVMAIIIDRTGIGPAVSVGLKSSTTIEEAIRGAMLEAQHVRGWIRFSYMAEGAPLLSKASKINGLKERGYYWYKLDRIKDLNFFLENDLECAQTIKRPKIYSVRARLLNKGYEIYTVDLSNNDVRRKGFSVVKSIVPQCHPLCLDEDYPYYAGERLSRYTDGKLNTMPHPFI